jgi:PAS domain S-box-containing protein
VETPPQGSIPDRGAAVPPMRREPAWGELLEGIPVAFYLDRPDGTGLWVSDRIEQLLEISAAEWLAGYEGWLDRVHPEDRERVMASARSFAETGMPESDEYRIVLGDGTVRWIHDRALLRPDEATGEPLVHGILLDVTEQHELRDATEQHSRLYEALVEHAREAVTIVGIDGAVRYINPSMGRVVGHPPEWFRGRSPLELMPPDDRARAVEILQRLADRPGAQLPGEFRLRHRDGSWRVVEGVATNLMHDPDVRGVVLNYRDVTGEREHERSLRELERRRRALLEEIVNAESEQRSRIADELHDDTLQILIACLVELDRSERHLQRGDVVAALHAISTARDTLNSATDRTREITFQLRPQLLEAAGLGAAVRELADDLRRDSGAEVSVRTRLGRYPVDIETLAYRTIREALLNVRKHARASQVTIRVVERRGALLARIEDNGRGFAETTRPRGGRRFGIEAASERVRAAGGTFSVTSEPGEGTTVEFRLPLPQTVEAE